jgi:hypothetical protein
MNKQNSKVQAYVSVNKNRLKIYEDNKYYLSNNTNFEIELVNNDDKQYLVEIYLNEHSIGSIIIGANSHNYLERYIDDNRKFQFNTFEIDNVEETEEARERNGSIQIYFYPQITSYPKTNFCYSSFTNSPFVNIPVDAYYSSTYSSNTIETGRINEGENSNQTFTYSSNSFKDKSVYSLDYQILPISLKPYEGIKTYCSECGTKIRHQNWKYCTNCGTKL